jgi:tetratricopeptide (TPR) repeat protein
MQNANLHRYVRGGKYDLAQEMCKKCLKYNKSCAKAWELIGQVMEREQSYMDAAEHYERSWWGLYKLNPVSTHSARNHPLSTRGT